MSNRYVGLRYVPKHCGVWDNTKNTAYERLSVVYYSGMSYTSSQDVPVGIDITNTTFWKLSADYNEQMEIYRTDVNNYKNQFTTSLTDSVFNVEYPSLLDRLNATSKRIANININLLDNGLKNDGTTDNSAILQTLIDSLDSTKSYTLFFPQGTYKFTTVVNITGKNNVTFDGQNALIDCSTQQAGFLNIGTTSNYINIKNLSFIGNNTNTTHINYRIITVIGNNCLIDNCTFKNTFGAGVELRGNYNTIQNCTFSAMNNGGWGYGSIEVNGAHNIVNNNIVVNFDFTGISCYGGSKNIITNNQVIGNNTYSTSQMGIWLLNGANYNVVKGNYIEYSANEGIVINSTITDDTKGNIVSDNIIKNCKYMAISLEKNNTGKIMNMVIENNICEIDDSTLTTSVGIGINGAENCNIKGNHIINFDEGIKNINTCARNTINNNTLIDNVYGINFMGTQSICDNNLISSSKTSSVGINYAYCTSDRICNNSIFNCATGLNGTTNSNLCHVANNFISNSNIKGNRQLFGDMQTQADGTQTYIIGTLTAGVANVTYYHVKQGDIFLAIPFSDNVSDTNTFGSLYVSTQDVNSSVVTVKSTNTNDTRSFILLKVSSGLSS
jgi:hypothetical protein